MDDNSTTTITTITTTTNNNNIEETNKHDAARHGDATQNDMVRSLPSRVESTSPNHDTSTSTTTTTIPRTVSDRTRSHVSTITTTVPPSFFILYILWKPDMTTDPQVFVRDTILTALTQLQVQYNVELQQSSNMVEYGPRNVLGTGTPTTSRGRNENGTHDSNATPSSPLPASQRSRASVYIVVDRIVPKQRVRSSSLPITTATNRTTVTSSSNTIHDTPANDSNETLRQQQQEEEEEYEYRLIERVGRAVASHRALREGIDGVTIGRSDHVRAAPGLELCVDALTKIGSIDRRRYKYHPPPNHQQYNQNSTTPSSPFAASNDINTGDVESAAKKSLLSLVAVSKDDLLGLQDVTNTDAAECVQQSTVTAEWYGQGDIYMFAARAHWVWQQRYHPVAAGDIPSSHYNTIDGWNTAGSHTNLPTSDPLFRKRKLPRRIAQPNRRDGMMVSSQRLSSSGNSTSSTPHRQPPRFRTKYRMTLQQERELWDDIYDLFGYVWVIAFILFHFVPFDVTLLISAYETLLSFLQALLRLWIDFIRSARGW